MTALNNCVNLLILLLNVNDIYLKNDVLKLLRSIRSDMLLTGTKPINTLKFSSFILNFVFFFK